MPRLEGPAVDRINQREAVEAHRLRIRDRLEQYRGLLAAVPAVKTEEHPQPEVERRMIQDAMEELGVQQRELEAKAPALLAQAEESDRIRAENVRLKTELEEANRLLNQATQPVHA